MTQRIVKSICFLVFVLVVGVCSYFLLEIHTAPPQLLFPPYQPAIQSVESPKTFDFEQAKKLITTDAGRIIIPALYTKQWTFSTDDKTTWSGNVGIRFFGPHTMNFYINTEDFTVYNVDIFSSKEIEVIYSWWLNKTKEHEEAANQQRSQELKNNLQKIKFK